MSRTLTASQRTVNGSYRPSYAQGPRRPPPPALRSDTNRSSSSLPSRFSPALYHRGYGPRVRTPSSPVSWTPRPAYGQTASSVDQSSRTGSLTSIVEMYQRPSTAGIVPPLRPPGSFYYDYSEEFETRVPRTMEPNIPLCPIPQRAASFSQPLVLRDETRARLDGTTVEPDLKDVDCHESNTEDNFGNLPHHSAKVLYTNKRISRLVSFFRRELQSH